MKLLKKLFTAIAVTALCVIAANQVYGTVEMTSIGVGLIAGGLIDIVLKY